MSWLVCMAQKKGHKSRILRMGQWEQVSGLLWLLKGRELPWHLEKDWRKNQGKKGWFLEMIGYENTKILTLLSSITRKM